MSRSSDAAALRGHARPLRIQTALCACLLLLAGGPALPADAQQAEDEFLAEEIDLTPEAKEGWGVRNVLAPVTGLFMGGPSYWYGERVVDVETTPPGAVVDLFYIRRNFQKRYEQAETPVRVILPSRIEAGPRDALTVRALLEGYRQESVTIRVSSREDKIHLELSPLPNSLVAVAHRYFAGRASLQFLTKEALTFRLQQAAKGFSVILTETGRTPEAAATLDNLHSPLIEGVVSRQLGEDLVVSVDVAPALRDNGWEPRSRQGYDPARDLYSFGLDMVPADGGAQDIQRAREALGRIRTADVTGCALEFEAALREGLDAAELSRALAPSGQFTDPYFRAAMRRLGELMPDGVVHFTDGSQFRPSVPIELEAAVSQAASARGFLALLRQFVAELEAAPYRETVFRGLVAPELDPQRFGELEGRGQEREAECRASAGMS